MKNDLIKRNGMSLKSIHGRVAVPILLWFMGVPGFFVILLWFFFFRGH